MIIQNTYENECKDDAKYIVCEKPNRYLAMNRKDNTRREWINSMLNSGISQVFSDKDIEPKSVGKYFGQDGVKSINAKVRTTNFTSIKIKDIKVGFWEYLIQILEYKVITNDTVFTSND